MMRRRILTGQLLRNPSLPLAVACGLFLAPGFTGCKKSGGGDVIKVGEYASLTGQEASFGQMSHHGTELAMDELNARGGVLGKKLALLTEDNQSKQGESKTCADKLISRDGVIALLGEASSGRSLEAAPICQEEKIPMIAPSSVDPKVTETGNYIFRVCFISSFQAKVMAKFALGTLKLKNVAMLTDVGLPYSVGMAEYFKPAFLAGGGKIIAEQNYTRGSTDFRAQLTAIRAAKPEGIFVPGYYTEAGLICRQAKELGMNVPIFGGDGWESAKLVEIGGEAVEGTFFSTHFSPKQKSAAVQEFTKKFTDRYKVEPDAMAALGYDSALLLADAIKRAGTTDGPKLREALAATKDFPGITGSITIDKDRNASKPAVILEVKGGKFEYLETINP
ncbi:MAG: ABC transporter substrate-binding protein [Verrucomicrobiota bacterium]